MQRISAVIISKNEARIIGQTIQAAQEIADEVLLVDSGSTDDTISIAKGLGARVIETDWKGYGATKNFANAQAKNDWILSLDADEVMSKALKETLLNLRFEEAIAYNFKIVMQFDGRKLRHTEYAPHFKPRLFHRSRYKWDDRVVHEKLIAIGAMKAVSLEGELEHYSFEDRAHFLIKLDHYARLSANELIRKGKTPSRMKRSFGPFYRFFRSYILKLGILEGALGLFISRSAGNLVAKRHEYFDELTKKDEL